MKKGETTYTSVFLPPVHVQLVVMKDGERISLDLSLEDAATISKDLANDVRMARALARARTRAYREWFNKEAGR